MRILTITTLFPNRMQIRNGIFVKERLKHWTPRASITCPNQKPHSSIERRIVIAPVPWFPFRSRLFGKYSTFAHVPKIENQDQFVVYHPRFLVIPKIGSLITPFSYYLAIRHCISKHTIKGFECIDVHFAFPDGAGVALLSRSLGVPFILTVRGSDINLMPKEKISGVWIRWALNRAQCVVAVSAALAKKTRSLMRNQARVIIIRNGIDTSLFSPKRVSDPQLESLRTHSKIALSVGNLVPLKGHDLVLRAIARTTDYSLIIIGSGPEHNRIATLIQELDLNDRVLLIEEISQTELVEYYRLADVTILASSSEGLPNVVLESLACGTPVIASRVGGTPEVIDDIPFSHLLTSRTAEAIRYQLQNQPRKNSSISSETAKSIETYNWADTARKLDKLFDSVICEYEKDSEIGKTA